MTDASFARVDERRKFFVVFQDRNRWQFWRWYCRPGWRHCWIISVVYFPEPGLAADRYCLKVEPLQWGIDTAVWFADPDVVVQAFYRAGVTAVVEYDADFPPAAVYIPRGIFTCVSTVKAVLGLRNWRVWTPWHLYRHLIRHGARLVKEDGASVDTGDFVDIQRPAEAERP